MAYTPAASRIGGIGEGPAPEPVETWHREIRALRISTAPWDAAAAEDEAALRRALTQHHQAAKGTEIFRLAREHSARSATERMVVGRL